MPVATGDAFRYITTTGTNVGESDATLIAPDVNGTLTIAGGFGITLTADATNRKITITNTGNGTGALTTITAQNSAGTYYPVFTTIPGTYNPATGTYTNSTLYYESTTTPLSYNPGTGTLNVNNLVLGGAGTFSLDGVTSTGVTGTGNLVFSSSPTFTTGITLAYDPIALGNNAGKTSQGSYSVAVGTNAGQTSQGGTAVAVGYNAGQSNQLANAVAIGWNAGKTSQGNSSIAIGTDAGNGSQGQYAIAIGASAGIGGTNAQAANTIILNASGLELDGVASQTNSFYVAPIRNTTSTSGILQYNSTTKEVTYSSSINPSTVNGMTISSSTGTFTLANSKTFTVNNTITLSGTDSTTITLPSTTGTVALNNQTFYIGSTQVAINRASGSITLNSTSIDGNAGTVTNGFYTTSSFNLGTTSIVVNRASGSQSLTGISIDGSAGSVAAGNITGTTLASNVTGSSLTSVGTLTNLTVTNTITGSVSGNAGTVTNGFYTTSSFNLGTTSIAVNRASSSQSLTGISIDGSAGKATNLVGGNATTLLGALPYQSNTDTTTLLSPNTSATPAVLTQTGNGTNGAAPVWTTTSGTGSVLLQTNPSIYGPSFQTPASWPSLSSSNDADLTVSAGTYSIYAWYSSFTANRAINVSNLIVGRMQDGIYH